MRRISKILAFFIFILIAFASVINVFDKDSKIFFRGPTLSEAVAKSLEGTSGNYAIVVKSLKKGDSYSLNEKRIFQPASLYKLWVMSVAFEKIKKGELKETDVLQASIEDLNEAFDLSPEEAELTEGSISLTVKQALEQMITVSHNYPALLLTREVKSSSVTNFLRIHGFTESTIRGETSKTTAGDIASFYEKLYNGEIVDSKYSKKMIDLLSKQQLNDRIPKYLPKGAKVAHKTGELFGFKHDAGIVFTENGDYIFVALSETNSPKGAAERIAKLSKDVYDYFSR